MNRQGKLVNNRVIGGIEWTKTILPGGIERPGWTWNPIAGCVHRCRWAMPDGTVAVCYAESVAERVAGQHYPHGFGFHYWHPERLSEPLRVKEPTRIFLDSMSDLMGYVVPEAQINAVLDTCLDAHWHTFLLLTKNAPRLLQFDFPANVHVGVSSPPDFMWGKELSRGQQVKMLERSLEVLGQVKVPVRWCSFEPLSWDVSEIVAAHPGVLQWAVIGAASNGPRYYQPEPEHVRRLLAVLDEQGVPVFFKGNMRQCEAARPWREELPLG